MWFGKDWEWFYRSINGIVFQSEAKKKKLITLHFGFCVYLISLKMSKHSTSEKKNNKQMNFQCL